MEKTKKLEKKDGFMKGVLALMVSQALIKMLGLVSKVFLTNKKGFGDVGNGIYGSGYQIYAMLLTISSIGVPNAIAKLISEKVQIKTDKLTDKKIGAKAFTSINSKAVVTVSKKKYTSYKKLLKKKGITKKTQKIKK